MYKRVLETIHRHTLLPQGAKIIIGVSGGPDSMTLLDILCRARTRRSYTLTIAHIHYGIRGADAQHDRNIVAAAARHYDIPFKEHNLSQKPHPHDEAWLRKERYAFFEEVRAQEDADCIAVGHTRDDLVETFLLHLLRGSGLAGLTNLAYKRETIVRPLLDCTRADVERYCKDNKIPFGIDQTNDDTTYLRNRIRHDLIPHLRDHYNPNIAQTLSRTAHTIRDDYASLLEYTTSRLPHHTQTERGITFSTHDFINLPPALQRMTLRIFARRIGAPHPSFGTINNWQTLITSTKNKTQESHTETLIVKKNSATVSMVMCAH